MEAYKVIIIGQGPAGLSAAIYTSRAGMKTLVLGCDPKVAGDYDIDNYFGFPETISGRDLIERGQKQAHRFGTTMICDRVVGIHPDDKGTYVVKTENNEYHTCAVILATGVSRIRPGIKNLDDYEGKGVSYCVSCDGFFFRNKQVLVLGEGNFAANQALELTQYTPHVTICAQGKPVTISDNFRQKLEETSISIIEKKIQTLSGGQGLDQVIFEDGESMPMDGLFVAMGEASSLDFAYSLGVVRKGNFIEVDEEQKTNIPGIFAAGDCVGRFLQISVAVGEGALAARAAISHIKKICPSK